MTLQEMIKEGRRRDKIAKSLPKYIPTKSELAERGRAIAEISKKMADDIEEKIDKTLFSRIPKQK